MTENSPEFLARLDAILTEQRATRAELAELRAAWAEYEPVVSAFRRGGLLAARSAAKARRAEVAG